MAAKIPKKTPIIIPKNNAEKISIAVFPTVTFKTSAISLSSEVEYPRSPVTTFFNQIPYLIGKARSKPSSARLAAISSGVKDAAASADKRTSSSSPGAKSSPRKTTVRVTHKTTNPVAILRNI
ncbi:unannotated protein [freshwater metagenome]|uniref:Unannotated protein n=1 Tax=freshwater metagenome TaxID=449393 RepID=A0A6J6PAZ4_9ZZZZ